MNEKMICPACRAEMNFHAEKLIYIDAEPAADTATGGRVTEIHACPHCGRIGSRPSGTLGP